MSFSQTVIIELVILAVVLESDLGRKKIGWFRIARPVVAAVLIVPFYLKSLPTSGNNLLLQAAGAVLGILLGLACVSPAFVSVGFDPHFRGLIARRRHRPGRPAAVSLSGVGYASVWIAVTVARLIFAYTSQHAFPHALGTFLAHHRLSADALTNALIFVAVGMDLFRSAGLLRRGTSARHHGLLGAAGPDSPATAV